MLVYNSLASHEDPSKFPFCGLSYCNVNRSISPEAFHGHPKRFPSYGLSYYNVNKLIPLVIGFLGKKLEVFLV